MGSMFFETNEQPPNIYEWEQLGKPKMYVKFFSDGNVTAWDEIAYGGIRLKVGDEVREGTNMVELSDYIALGYFYTASSSVVYKRISKS